MPSRRALVLGAAALPLSAACGGPTTADGEVRWGDGAYGVVLAHGAAYDADSWDLQARQIADFDTTVVAVEDITPASILTAVQRLQKDGHRRVALVGASAGADAVLRLSSQRPDLADQLILISPNATVDGLGDQPKLFVASIEEPVADVTRELTVGAPGSDNRGLLLPGSAHAQAIFKSDEGPRALSAILERIKQRAG